jgi:hypothetical protein
MDIQYIDYDPLDAAGVYDNSRDEDIAKEMSKKDAELQRRAQIARIEIARLRPPPPVKCPSLSKLNI